MVIYDYLSICKSPLFVKYIISLCKNSKYLIKIIVDIVSREINKWQYLTLNILLYEELRHMIDLIFIYLHFTKMNSLNSHFVDVIANHKTFTGITVLSLITNIYLYRKARPNPGAALSNYFLPLIFSAWIGFPIFLYQS